MTRIGKIFIPLSMHFMLGSLPFFFSLGSFHRIEFEPTDILYITTDSVQQMQEDNYMLSGSILNIGTEEILEHGFSWSDTRTPITDASTNQLGIRDSIGSFSSIISGLKLRTTYLIRSYAVTPSGTEYGNDEFFRTPPPVIDSIVKDYDGNIYKVVVIGIQGWMAENLRTTHYADGTAIPQVENDSAWDDLDEMDRAYSWYDNDPSNAHYGAYYSWAAAMNGEGSHNANPSGVQGVCPDGWHIPSDDEWNQMQIHLGMYPNDSDNVGFVGTRQSIGNKMKGIGIPFWENLVDQGQYNESGFTALPCGQRSNTGLFCNVETYAYFWSASEYDKAEAWYRNLQYGHRGVLRVHIAKDYGFSIRCVMD